MALSDLATQFDRLPPQDIPAEQALLGSIIIAPPESGVIEEVRAIIQVDAWYQPDHAVIYGVLIEMHDRKTPVDVITLRDELVRLGKYDEVGGKDMLAMLMSSVPSSANAIHYAKIVAEKHHLRQGITAANDFLRAAYQHHDDAQDGGGLVAEAAERFAIIAAGRQGPKFLSVGEMMEGEYFALAEDQEPLIPFGFGPLDEETSGIEAGELVIIGARPSMGKSTIGRQIVLRASALGTPTLLISLEEGRKKLARNWLSAESSIENHLIRKRKLTPDHFSRMAQALARTESLPAWAVVDAFDLRSIRAAIARHIAKFGVKLVIIDFLQNIRLDGRNRYEQVTAIAQEIQCMAKEFNVALIVMAQLSRDLLRRENHRPTMGDLKESGKIEEAADGLIFLHREDYYHLHDEENPDAAAEPYTPTGIAELIIAKWRDGERGKTVKLRSRLKFQRFDDLDPADDIGGAL